jgi:2-amino-4-hydroxy-6-hydroxymethyldihydropteridine diphosphokinase
MPRALVALGANLGDRASSLDGAVERIAREAAAGKVTVSSWHETAPVGGPSGQEVFLNAATAFDTNREPESLHALLKRIECDLGRIPGERWGARAIDLDLLLYEDSAGARRVIVTPELQIPHPRMSFRRFVLEPAAEVAPNMVHPVIGWSVERLLDHLNHAERNVLILGLSEAQPAALAEAAARLHADSSLQPVTSKAISLRLDPSGRTSGRPIQFLDRIASEFAGVGQTSETVIGACCVDVAASGWSSLEAARFDVGGQPVAPRETPLQLLILLDDWEAFVAARRGTIDREVDPRRQLLLQLAAHEYQGPVLCAGRTDREAQLTEITAALVAMR